MQPACAATALDDSAMPAPWCTRIHRACSSRACVLLAGAELFGANDAEADAEVVALMVDALHCAGIDEPVIELGHVGIFRSLAAAGKFDSAREAALFLRAATQSEARSRRIVGGLGAAQGSPRRFSNYPICSAASPCARSRAAERFKGQSSGVLEALDELQELAQTVAQRCEHVKLRFDLCELTGYGYHTGAVFAAYSENFGRAVARGGRYDGVGVSFGRARPATGFDVNLKRLLRSSDARTARRCLGARPSLGAGEATRRVVARDSRAARSG